MDVLATHEESQAVCMAFRLVKHRAFSLDLLPCSGGHPEFHYMESVFPRIYADNEWDLIISFPPCTDLSVSGARWFQKKRLSGEQEKSIDHFIDVWIYSDCTENPIGIMNNGEYIKKWFPKLYDKALVNGFPFKPSQIIQPWQFGHGETKATCLWLKGLPLLTPTKKVDGREPRIWELPPTSDRAKLRSKTYQGIADAMAVQWGHISKKNSRCKVLTINPATARKQ